MLRIEHRLYTLDEVSFLERLKAVEWWTEKPVSRDYVRLKLSSQDGVVEALAFVDRETQKRYLHAIFD